MHESEQRHRLSPPAARAAPPASPRPFPQPDPSPQSPSSVTSMCRVLACKVAAPPFVKRRVIGQKRIDQILAAPASMRNAEWPCHVSFIGILSLVICLKPDGGCNRQVAHPRNHPNAPVLLSCGSSRYYTRHRRAFLSRIRL